MTNDDIFLGMCRPRWESVLATEPQNRPCPACGESLVNPADWSRNQAVIYSHWLRGHFDTPVYATREEILEIRRQQTSDHEEQEHAS